LGTPIATFVRIPKSPLHKGVEDVFFESWWERVPLYARVAVFVVSIVGMVLGGSAGGYWE